MAASLNRLLSGRSTSFLFSGSQSCRPLSQKAFRNQKLVMKEHGDPREVLRLVEEDIAEPNPGEVLIKMLVCPMNPADMNTIQGTYPIKPKLPAVPGHEGVGKVVAVGKDVTNVSVGDHVIPNIESLGTWRTYGVFPEMALLKIPNNVPLVSVANVASNASTAYRLIKDFVQLTKHDCVVQNGANSAAGQNVIQLCRVWDIKTVNVVRDRPNIDELKESLTNLGATFVLTEDEFRKTEIFKKGECPSPKLALNCVGGKSGSELIRKLIPDGVMVTYGGMSREPVIVPTSAFIFKRVNAQGFWMTRWTQENRTTEKRKEMLSILFNLMIDGKLQPPAHSLIPIKDFKLAIDQSLSPKGFAGRKFFLDFREP